jgi:hypothetical protein
MQAAKVSKPTFEGDCRTEIEALRNLGKDRMHIVKMVRADDTENGWLTIEPLGKTLDLLKSKTRAVKGKSRWFRNKTDVHIPPVAFGWHLIHQLAEAFLELHFGMVSGSSIRGSARYVHGDLHGSNLMFRLPTSSQGYPDLVIIDLGRVTTLQEGPGDKTDFYRAQAMDVVMGGLAIKPILSGIMGNMSADDAQLAIAFDRLSDCFPQESSIGNGNRRLERLLIELRDEASERRRALYQPLHAETASYLAEELMTDDELLEKLTQLSAPVSESSESDSAFVVKPNRNARSADCAPRHRGISKRQIEKERQQREREILQNGRRT